MGVKEFRNGPCFLNIHYTTPTPCLHLKEAALKVLQKYLFLVLKKCQPTYNTLRTRPGKKNSQASMINMSQCCTSTDVDHRLA